MHKINTTALPSFLDGRGIGFDRVFDMLDNANRTSSGTYPPYNVIQVDEVNTIVELAVAGFSEDSIEITQDRNKLKIEGNQPSFDETEVTYLHKGISSRSFTREFVLADHVIVQDAVFTNGILSIKLLQDLPEEMKPRQIAINKPSK